MFTDVLWRNSKSKAQRCSEIYLEKQEMRIFKTLKWIRTCLEKVVISHCCILAINKTAIVHSTEEVINDFYIDDYQDSFYTVQKTIKILNDVTNTLRRGGFCLAKWVYNEQQILKALPSQLVSSRLVNRDFDDISHKTQVGILWNPGTRCISNQSNRKRTFS